MTSNWGNISIAIIAITVLLATAIATLKRENSRSGAAMFAALSVTALLELFDLCSLLLSDDSFAWKQAALFAEAALPLLWVLASLTYARQEGPWKIGRILQCGLVFAGMLLLLPMFFSQSAFFYAPDFPEERVLFLESTGLLFLYVHHGLHGLGDG